MPKNDVEYLQSQYNNLGTWLLDFIRRCEALGMDLGYNPQASAVVSKACGKHALTGEVLLPGLKGGVRGAHRLHSQLKTVQHS